MGWASGSELAADIWSAVSKRVPERKQKRLAQEIIYLFEMQDCDTLYECEDLCKAAGQVFNEETGEYTYE